MKPNSRFPRTVNLEKLGQEAASLLRELCEEGGAVLVSEAGEAAAVVLSVDDYRRVQNDLALLRRLALGELECKSGVGYELEHVLAECDLLLEEN